MLLKSNLLKSQIPVKHLHNYSPKVNSQKQWYIIPISHCPVLFFPFCEEGLVYLSSGLDPRRGEKILVGSEFKANNKLLIKIHISVHTHPLARPPAHTHTHTQRSTHSTLASINNIVTTYEKNGDENRSLKTTCAEIIKAFSKRKQND